MRTLILILLSLTLAGCLDAPEYSAAPAAAPPPDAFEATEAMDEPEPTMMRSAPPRASHSLPDITGMRRASPPAEAATEAFNTDAILDQLSLATIALAVPDKANLKNKIQAQLLMSMFLDETTLREELTAAGSTFSGGVLVSRVVHAKLTAPDFEVEAITPERQAISTTSNTEWLWNLTPKSVGEHQVYLTITAFVYVDESNFIERHIRTFQKVVVIEVTPEQVIKAWFGKYWQWLWSALLLPIFLYFRKKYKKTTE